MGCRIPISRYWRYPWFVWVLFILEVMVSVGALALYGIASPDLYRTKLWQDGADNGFNSAPILIVFSYTNGHPEPTPLVWSQFITDYNVVISVLSLFVMIVKVVMFIMHVFYPIFGFLTHGALMALYAYSVYAQTSHDLLDPNHPQPGAPWYITKSCDVAHDPNNVHYCMQAKGALAVAAILMSLFFFNTVLALWSMIPTKSERKRRRGETEPEKEKFATSQEQFKTQWEMSEMESARGGGMRSPQPPVTPRTKAFNSLGGIIQGAGGPVRKDLPLRNS